MKNFTLKRGFFAATAVLLAVTAMLVTIRCSNDIGIGHTDDYTPPQGKGAVRINIDKKITRTILPDNATLASFDKFEFQFTPTSGGTAKNIPNIDPADLYEPIDLDPGTYSLTVIAYIEDSSNTMQPAATATVSVTITAAQTTNATIVLKAYDPTATDGDGNGTLKYKIDCIISTSNIDTAYINLTKIGSAGTNLSSIDIKTKMDNAYYTQTVKAGYYYLDFEIKVKTGDIITFRHIVQIYQNMTSSFDFTISADYFNAVFQLISSDLTYENPADIKPVLAYQIPSTSNIEFSVSEGGTININQGDTVKITITNTSDFDNTNAYEFWYSYDNSNSLYTGTNAYYTVNATNGNEFYGKKTYQLAVVGYDDDSKPYYTYINIKVQDLKPELVYGGSSTAISKGGTIIMGQDEQVTVEISNTGSFDSFEFWYSDDPSNILYDSGDSYIVDSNAGNEFNTIKTYTLTVVGIKDSMRYYTYIDIDVQ